MNALAPMIYIFMLRYCMPPMWTTSMDRRLVTTRWTLAGSKLSLHTLDTTTLV